MAIGVRHIDAAFLMVDGWSHSHSHMPTCASFVHFIYFFLDAGDLVSAEVAVESRLWIVQVLLATQSYAIYFAWTHYDPVSAKSQPFFVSVQVCENCVYAVRVDVIDWLVIAKLIKDIWVSNKLTHLAN